MINWKYTEFMFWFKYFPSQFKITKMRESAVI